MSHELTDKFRRESPFRGQLPHGEVSLFEGVQIVIAALLIHGGIMPKKLEQQLKKQAAQKGLSEKRADAYVYGTMRKTGWKPKQEKKG